MRGGGRASRLENAARQGKALQEFTRRQALAAGFLQLRNADCAAAAGNHHAVCICLQDLPWRSTAIVRKRFRLPEFDGYVIE